MKRLLLTYNTCLLQHYRKETTKHWIHTMTKNLVAVCQMRSISDKQKNLEVVTELVGEAKKRLAIMAFFPEACDYMAENKVDIIKFAEPLDGPTVTQYKELAVKNDMWLSMGGVHEKVPDNENKVFNTHILIDNKGNLVSAYRKIHLFDMDNKETGVRLMESDYVLKGDTIVPPVCSPIGKMALSICYDMRFPEQALVLRNLGAEILTYPSAFTYQTGAAHWEILLRSRAIENQCYVIAAAQTGMHNKKRVSWGHALIIDPWGTVIDQCSDKIGIAVGEIDLDFLSNVRKNMPCEKHRRTDLYPLMEPQRL